MLHSQRLAEQPSSHSVWERWLAEGTLKLEQAKLLRSLRPIQAIATQIPPAIDLVKESGEIPQIRFQKTRHDALGKSILEDVKCTDLERPAIVKEAVEYSDGRGEWDLVGTTAQVSAATLSSWIHEQTSAGDELSSVDSPPTHLKLFSGNDYLGLALHPAVRAAAAKAALLYGMGPRSSPLVCGYTTLHRELETALATLCHTEECLLCPTGFSANMAAITALASNLPQKVPPHSKPAPAPPPSAIGMSGSVAQAGGGRGGREEGGAVDEVAIFSDALNHASIIDGVRLVQRQGGVKVHVYKHKDMEHLESLLSRSTSTRKVVVTDSLFSMDGDFAPLKHLAALRTKYGFLLMLDEAHATLVCGPTGGGAAEACGVIGSVDIHVGTLSKAVGCQGGFIACSRGWKQWMVSRGRSFVYSTALPIPVVAAALAALEVARNERWRQKALWENVRLLSHELGIEFQSAICPILIGGAKEALEASRSLLSAGFHVPAIRPPTVAEGSSRLRVALSASHTLADILALVAALPPTLKSKTSHYNPFKPLHIPLFSESAQRRFQTLEKSLRDGEQEDGGRVGDEYQKFMFNHVGVIGVSRL